MGALRLEVIYLLSFPGFFGVSTPATLATSDGSSSSTDVTAVMAAFAHEYGTSSQRHKQAVEFHKYQLLQQVP